MEVTSLFRKKYSHFVRFYFDDVSNLYDFKQWAAEQEVITNAQFSLRMWGSKSRRDSYEHWDSEDESPCAWGMRHDVTWRLIFSEPGLQDMFNKYIDACQMTHRASDCSTLIKYLPTDFQLLTGGQDKQQNAFYRALVFPSSAHNLHITFYQRKDNRPMYSRMTELSGGINNLTFDGFDVGSFRARLYYARDSPWLSSRYRRSPDLDEADRLEMDAVSWGVPDSDTSENESENDAERGLRLADEGENSDGFVDGIERL